VSQASKALESRQERVDTKQQTADSRQQTVDSRQQTADSRQQTADSKEQRAKSNKTNLVVDSEGMCVVWCPHRLLPHLALIPTSCDGGDDDYKNDNDNDDDDDSGDDNDGDDAERMMTYMLRGDWLKSEKGVRLAIMLNIFVGASSWCVVFPARKSSGVQAISMKTLMVIVIVMMVMVVTVVYGGVTLVFKWCYNNGVTIA
jgi:hypothetical protein